MRTNSEIELLVQHLQKGDWSSFNSDAANHSDIEAVSALIMSKWLKSTKVSSGASGVVCIHQIMEKLESCAITYPGLALELMNALQPLADELYRAS